MSYNATFDLFLLTLVYCITSKMGDKTSNLYYIFFTCIVKLSICIVKYRIVLQTFHLY